MENNTVENEKPKKKRVKIKKLKEEKKEENKPIHEYLENKTENQIQQTMNKIIFKPMKLYIVNNDFFNVLMVLQFLPKNHNVVVGNLPSLSDPYAEFIRINGPVGGTEKMLPFFHCPNYETVKNSLISSDRLGNRDNNNNEQNFKYAYFDYLETNYMKIKNALGINKNIRDMENVIKIIDNNKNSFRREKMWKIKRIYDVLIDFTLTLIHE